MENILLEIAKQVPNAVAVIVTVWLFLNAQTKAEESRVANAKALEAERQKHEQAINNVWAKFFKEQAEKSAEHIERIIDEIHRHEDASIQRYSRLKITENLKKAAQGKLKQQEP